ncbi:MAG: VIT1/CCC1 transporter family protein [Anaerolineales bacterium]|nr:VIT1/CCC1 transporter family protein [Anaerolineales bacterium]
MASKALPPKIQTEALKWQRAEITGHETYNRLADVIKDPYNQEVVRNIAKEEAKHYQTFKSYTGKEVSPNRFQVFIYTWIARLLGLTFGIKLMERGEEWAQLSYEQFRTAIPEIDEIIQDEEEHEDELLGMLDEELLKYTGSVVLGLNDALVELTGALAGLTFAFQNTRLIAVTGLITGVSAALSMAASEYLSTRAEESEASPSRSALYTGVAYIFTVILLVLPFFLLTNYLFCLAWTLINAIVIIALFNFYLAVAKDLKFGKRFLEMAVVSVSVAAFSFLVGYVVRQVFGIDI